MTIVGVLAGIFTLFVGLYWDVRLLGGQYGLHGGWGFEIFIAAFAGIYVPVALVRRSRQRRHAKKTDDGGNPS